MLLMLDLEFKIHRKFRLSSKQGGGVSHNVSESIKILFFITTVETLVNVPLYDFQMYRYQRISETVHLEVESTYQF